LVIVKTTAAFPEYLVTLPEPRYLLKHSNNFLSLSCWVTLNINCILYPIGFDGRSEILTPKLPSPDTKPETQLGSGISSVLITGLSTGIKSLS
jgi:hypothetical protein